MALIGAAALSAVVLAAPGPARAASRYNFAYGAGKHAHMWTSSQYGMTTDSGPGTCTIDQDAIVAAKAPQTNAIDSVVLSPRALGISGTTVPITWGASNLPPAGVAPQIFIRFVTVAPGCPHTDVTLGGPGPAYSLSVPGSADLMVVSVSEGAVQPWFTV